MMMNFHRLCLTCLSIAVIFGGLLDPVNGLPLAINATKDHQDPQRAMISPARLEGDILVKDEAHGGSDGDRTAIRDRLRLWPQGIIPYEINASKASDPEMMSLIREAMNAFHRWTCIRFVKRNPSIHTDYVLIGGTDGCYSEVGRSGGQQIVSLGSGCSFRGIAIHELLHAVGFWHEHMRQDRDDYVDIIWDNIHRQYHSQFALVPQDEIRNLTPFDYESVMLYGSTAFSKDGHSYTMVKKGTGDRLKEVHEKYGLSQQDIQRVNKLYECD